MKVRVQVLEQDIRRGRRRSPCGCPIALALQRAVGEKCTGVSVGRHTTSIMYAKNRYSTSLRFAALPEEAVQFVHDYDHDFAEGGFGAPNPVKPRPFEFDLVFQKGAP